MKTTDTYRAELFAQLLWIAGAWHFEGARILEVGPKDGLDSARLARLGPRQLVLLDLPEKLEGSQQWREAIGPCQYVQANLLYLTPSEFAALGAFGLIWCTGVLYHNAEQLRLLCRLHQLLVPGGYLVLESATARGPRWRRRGCYVEVHYPETYRDVETITHLPSAGAVRAWLAMAGFAEIHDVDCYRAHNRDLIGQRAAWICRKGEADQPYAYYTRTGLNPLYVVGESS